MKNFEEVNISIAPVNTRCLRTGMKVFEYIFLEKRRFADDFGYILAPSSPRFEVF
jgi:hypothetical protein